MEWFNLEDSVNALTLLGTVAILGLTVFITGLYIKKIKDSRAEGELDEAEYDGIRKFKNDIPIGWGIAYLVIIIWGLWYWFVGYPLNAYSQIGEYNEELGKHQAKFEKKWANADEKTLADMGQSLFLVQCSQCHGQTSEGLNGKAADLTKWGREEFITFVVLNGSTGLNYPLGAMPGGMLDEASAKAVAAFVVSEIAGTKKMNDPELIERGREAWISGTCNACHGEDGRGLEGQSPDLTQYGKAAFLADVLNRGKKGQIGTMPAFKAPMLNDTQKRALASFIYAEK